MALYLNGKKIINSLVADGGISVPMDLVLSETATGQTYTFSDDFEGYVLIMGRDANTFEYDAPTVSVQDYKILLGNNVAYDRVTIQKTFIKCKAKSGDYITINDYYSSGEFYLFEAVIGGDTELPKFKDFYTIPSLSTITGTIKACYAMRNLFGAGTYEHFWHICTDTDPFIYYNTNSNQIIRDNRWVCNGYLLSVNLCEVWYESVTPVATPTPVRVTGKESYNISQSDLGNYLYLRTTDILDQDGNIILPANCTIADFGITQ